MTQRDPDGASAHITRRRLLQLALATGALSAARPARAQAPRQGGTLKMA